jgi:hypothetical protein
MFVLWFFADFETMNGRGAGFFCHDVKQWHMDIQMNHTIGSDA